MNPEIAESFSMMVKQKNVDKDYLVEVLKDVFQILIAKKFGEGARSEVIVNMDRGDIEIYYLREIVDEVTDPVTQISLDEVNERGNEDELDTGDDYMEKIPVTAFGRRLINLIKQNLNQKITGFAKPWSATGTPGLPASCKPGNLAWAQDHWHCNKVLPGGTRNPVCGNYPWADNESWGFRWLMEEGSGCGFCRCS